MRIYDVNFSPEKRSIVKSASKYHKEVLSEYLLNLDELYIWGNLTEADRNAVAVVGSRKMTPYGKRSTEYFVRKLVSEGITIVSGCMYGVDLYAHQCAINVEGRTIAVLGYGLKHVFKVRYAQGLIPSLIDEKKGAFLSQFPLKSVPFPWTFPKRNYLIAALSKTIIVIEAGLTSGTLITVGYALDQGKEVFVVPGTIFSETSMGKHMLIKQGATLLDDPDQILDHLKIPTRTKTNVEKYKILVEALSPEEKKVYDVIVKGGEVTINELVDRTKIPISKLTQVLTFLEIKKIVKIHPDKILPADL